MNEVGYAPNPHGTTLEAMLKRLEAAGVTVQVGPGVGVGHSGEGGTFPDATHRLWFLTCAEGNSRGLDEVLKMEHEGLLLRSRF